MRGKFITFEGGEGSGKSLQARLFRDHLVHENIYAEMYAEPSKDPHLYPIRKYILGHEGSMCDPFTLTLLFCASRFELVDVDILPALKAGTHVLCDRFMHSTVAYQHYGYGVPRSKVDWLNRHATQGLMPDKIIFMDIDPKLALDRKNKENFLDEKDLEFHKRVYAGYQDMAKADPARWVVIDATQSIDEVHRCVLAAIMPELGY